MTQTVRTKFIVFLCFFFSISSPYLFAQDILVLNSGDEIEVITEEIGRHEIWYKKVSNPHGPTYTIPISDVFMIKYTNGEKDVFNKNTEFQYVRPSFNKKEPGMAFLLSLLLPGGGQYYNGQYAKGALMTGVHLGSFVGMIACLPRTTYYSYGNGHYEDSGSAEGFVLFGLILLGNSLWSMIDAPISANSINFKKQSLTWNMGNKSKLSIKPDLSFNNFDVGGNKIFSPSYGAKLSLSLQ
ncbi:hypothetical protein AwDysgo_08540 [Bacteroidales bacterium]|nr:hypothetical protein AwDysgo_08540 [Bacteroidales bacterium]